MATKHPIRDGQMSHEMFGGKIVVKDEWSETMQQLKEVYSDENRERTMGETGLKMVADIRRHMTMSKGYADQSIYAPLRIEYRVHGRKYYSANKRNLAKASAVEDMMRKQFGKKKFKFDRRTRRVVDKKTGEVSQRKEVQLVQKTKVTASTRPLIDTGRLRRSWSVLKAKPGLLEVGPSNPGDMMKAIWNDDRGRWYFDSKNINDLTEFYINNWMDVILFGASPTSLRSGGTVL